MCIVIYIGKGKPLMKDIDNYVVGQWASHWQEIGRQLNIEEYLKKNIHHDYPNDSVRCCGKMLSDWLDHSSQPTWEKLVTAFNKITKTLTGLLAPDGCCIIICNYIT